MYSPADFPSRWRAAPAKNRIWSTSGGISSAKVTAIGLPVFWRSRPRTRSSARASKASAMRNRARLRSDGVASRHSGKAAAAAAMAASTSLAPGHRGLEVLLAGAGVDQHGRGAVRGLDVPAPDEVGQASPGSTAVRSRGRSLVLPTGRVGPAPPDGALRPDRRTPVPDDCSGHSGRRIAVRQVFFGLNLKFAYEFHRIFAPIPLELL